MGDCKLGGERDVKLIKAHIIPHSLYGSNLNGVEGPARLLSNLPDQYPKRAPLGVYDDTIVCESCEAKFSPWDQYAHQLLVKEPYSELRNGEKVVGHQYDAYDYVRLKLFFVSLLWRAHASSQKFFSKVNVGPHADRLAEMVLTGDPGEPDEYAVVIARFDQPEADGFLDPHPARIPASPVNLMRMYFAQHLFFIKVDKRSMPFPLSKFMLKPGQPLVVLLRNFVDSKELDVMKKIVSRVEA